MLVVLSIIVVVERIADPQQQAGKPRLDIVGAVLSAVGLFASVPGVSKQHG
jgi:hypothetical protein